MVVLSCLVWSKFGPKGDRRCRSTCHSSAGTATAPPAASTPSTPLDRLHALASIRRINTEPDSLGVIIGPHEDMFRSAMHEHCMKRETPLLKELTAVVGVAAVVL